MSFTYHYPRPAVTVDALVFWLQPQDMQVLLIKRKKDPFKGCWSFLFGETFNIWSYLGMLLVLLGVIANIWYKSRKVITN